MRSFSQGQFYDREKIVEEEKNQGIERERKEIKMKILEIAKKTTTEEINYEKRRINTPEKKLLATTTFAINGNISHSIRKQPEQISDYQSS